MTPTVWMGVAILNLVTGTIVHGAGAENRLILLHAVQEALKNNPEIHVLKYKLQSAHARSDQATYLEDPEIAIQFGGVPFSQPTSLIRSDTNSIGIRQRFPFFGKLSLKEKIAVQEAKVVEQELRTKEREIMAMAKIAYADLFMAQRAVEILREQLEIIRTIIGATEARYRVGRVTQQDVFKAQLEQSQILSQLIVAEEEADIAAVKLNTLMYRPPRTPILVPPDIAVGDSTVNLAALDDMALMSRPELRGAEQEIQRAEAAYELADRNRKYPDFMLGWDYMRMPTEMQKDRYAAMMTITIPFSPWTAGKRTFEVEESLAEMRVARSNREAIKNMTLGQVGAAEARAQAAKRSLELYREGLLTQAEISFNSALSAYQAGRVEFVNLLEAQRALREARMGYYKASVSFMQNLAELERAVGRELQ